MPAATAIKLTLGQLVRSPTTNKKDFGYLRLSRNVGTTVRTNTKQEQAAWELTSAGNASE
jgi:hypothetical protein